MEQYFPVGCIKKAKQMADSLSLLPDLELYLFDDSEVKTDDIGRFYTRDALPVWTSFGKHFANRPVIRL